MSILTVVDLGQTDEVSYAGMGEIMGGDKKCDDAMASSKLYKTLGDISLDVFGDTQTASYYYGKSMGVMEGGCPK